MSVRHVASVSVSVLAFVVAAPAVVAVTALAGATMGLTAAWDGIVGGTLAQAKQINPPIVPGMSEHM